jgi:hypothetical protein
MGNVRNGHEITSRFVFLRKLPPVPPVAIHIQPLSGLKQTGPPPVLILSCRSEDVPTPIGVECE